MISCLVTYSKFGGIKNDLFPRPLMSNLLSTRDELVRFKVEGRIAVDHGPYIRVTRMSHFHRAAEVIAGKPGLLGGNAASTFCWCKLGPLIPIGTLNGKFNFCNGKGLTFEDKASDGGKRPNRDRIRIVLAQKASECSLSGVNTWS